MDKKEKRMRGEEKESESDAGDFPCAREFELSLYLVQVQVGRGGDCQVTCVGLYTLYYFYTLCLLHLSTLSFPHQN
jgi:hypothetical protein